MKTKGIKCNSWKLKKEENKNLLYKHTSYNKDVYHHLAFFPCKLNDPPSHLEGEGEEGSHLLCAFNQEPEGQQDFPVALPELNGILEL